LSPRPAGDMEGAARVSAGRGALGDVVRAESVNDDAAADDLRGVHAGFGKDEKALTADGAVDAGGELRLLTYVHGVPAFGQNDAVPGLLFRPGYHDDFGDVTGRSGRACEKRLPSELR
jgi:hypothetical protein